MKFKSEVSLLSYKDKVEGEEGEKEPEKKRTMTFGGIVNAEDLKGIFPDEEIFEQLIDRFYGDDCTARPFLQGMTLAIVGIGVAVSIKGPFSDPIKFDNRANVRDFEIELLPERRVDIKFSIEAYPEPEQTGELFRLLKQGVTISASWKKTEAEEKAKKSQTEMALRQAENDQGEGDSGGAGATH